MQYVASTIRKNGARANVYGNIHFAACENEEFSICFVFKPLYISVVRTDFGVASLDFRAKRIRMCLKISCNVVDAPEKDILFVFVHILIL